jgi:hypothetical protein
MIKPVYDGQKRGLSFSINTIDTLNSPRQIARVEIAQAPVLAFEALLSEGYSQVWLFES